MAEKKNRLLTPVGFAKWAHIQTPKAAFMEKDGKSKGDPKYMIDVCFSADDPGWQEWAGNLKAVIKTLPAQTDKHTGNVMQKQMPIKRELSSDEQPTGRFYVTFKTGEKFKPPVFNNFGVALPETLLVGNESKVRVSYTPVEYTAFGGGIALYLNAVQVIELVEYKPQTAVAYGFEVEQFVENATPSDFSDFESDIPF